MVSGSVTRGSATPREVESSANGTPGLTRPRGTVVFWLTFRAEENKMRATASTRLVIALMAGVALLASAVSAGAQASREEPRIALLIGNSAYPEAPLKNPVNDVRAMAQSAARPGLHRDGPRERRQAHHGDGDRRVRAPARRGRRRRVLLCRSRPASAGAQLPGAGRCGHRFRGRHPDRRRRPRAPAGADERGQEPGESGDPRRLPQQPVRAAAAGRLPRPGGGGRRPGNAGRLRHLAGVGGRGRNRHQRPVHGGVAPGAPGAGPQGRGRLQARASQRHAPVERSADAVGILLPHRRPGRERGAGRRDRGDACPCGGRGSRRAVLVVGQGRERSRRLPGLSRAVSRRHVRRASRASASPARPRRLARSTPPASTAPGA